MKRIRVGVAGVGFIGEAHVEALKRTPYVDVVAIAEKYGAKEKAEKLDVPYYFEDYKEMIDTCDLDSIHICTPNDTHMDAALYAFEHGLHVICEKPMARDSNEARIMLDAAEKSGKVHAINFHNRFYPMMHNLRNMIKDGELGDIYAVHGGYLQDWLLYETDFNWRITSKQSGKTRAISDIGSHWIDLAEYVIGQKVTEVFAEFKCVYPTRRQMTAEGWKEVDVDTEDMAYILLRFDGGAIGSGVISTMFSGKKNQTTLLVSGSKMSAEWDNEKLEQLLLGCRDEINRLMLKNPKLCHEKSASVISYPAGHMEGFPDAFKQNFIAIYEAIRGETPPKPFATFEDGLHQMIICDKLYESAQTGKWIKL